MESPWDDRSFASKGGIFCGTISCAKWTPASLHQIVDIVHISMDLAIDNTLAADPDTNLLGPFFSTDANF